MGDMEPEPSTFCNKARPQVERLGYQPSSKTVNLQFVLPLECSGASHISFVIYNIGRRCSLGFWENSVSIYMAVDKPMPAVDKQ